ncbi:hypothetical protein DEU56DRAFT_470542 [Suillus clintonianus]|uniref:uncharacterized protein n=1 Tax=Suillus clintonianus TaxID=1904413 RepID=UPI001B87AE22|nr:uncharacterized protein DEU56DRAFT_470542 [Suillus clintonianus]KAG2153157.1 hypothetical protein DEU56DRAFT_470542 [Suillus clintonianus]
MLQPMKDEPPLSSKCKNKFLIQSTLITPEKETRDLHGKFSSKNSVLYTSHPKDKLLKRKMRDMWSPLCLPSPSFLQSTLVVHLTMQLSTIQSRALLHLCQISLSTTRFKLHRLCNPSAPPHHLHQNESGRVGVVNVSVHPPSPPPSPLVARVDQQLRDRLAAVPDPSSLAPESISPTSIAPSDFRRRHTSALSDDGETYAGSDAGTMVEHDSVIHLTRCLYIAIFNLI